LTAQKLRLATRGSPLARWQAADVAERLGAAHPDLEVETVVVDTVGDRRQDRPVWELGGQGVFVKEVQSALLEGRADIAVHSAKDLPSTTADGLALASVPVRADPRDALVGAALADLPAGAVVATGSVRRRAQLAWLRPDLTFTSLRGNIATRLNRLPPGGAVVVAAAALERLGLEPERMEVLAPETMVPQVGQGAIAVECRDDDGRARELLEAIDDPTAHRCVTAERAFLARLGGGCDLPVGAHCRTDMRMDALLSSLDGRVMLRAAAVVDPAAAPTTGVALAEELLGAGGRALLADSGLDVE
jgi:hydroxymethylbilane synthase